MTCCCSVLLQSRQPAAHSMTLACSEHKCALSIDRSRLTPDISSHGDSPAAEPGSPADGQVWAFSERPRELQQHSGPATGVS